MRTKQYQSTKEIIPSETISASQAVTLLQKNVSHKFDQTIEIHIRLGVNASKSDQMVRGIAHLPSGSVKNQRLAVFTEDAKLKKAAQAAGAVAVGGEDLIKTIIAAGSLDADLAIATPDMMPKVAKAARVLGPKGLMPNPKTGTVTADPIKAINDLNSGQVSFKMDQLGNIHQSVGKISWDESTTTANITAFLSAVKSARPSSAKGELIKKVIIKTTMSPAIRITA